MTKEFGKNVASLAVSLVLTACGGGGGGGGTVPTSTTTPVATTFTSWSAVQPGSTVKASGIGLQVPATWDGSKIVSVAPPVSVTASGQFGFDSSTNLTLLTLTAGGSTAGFTGSQIASFAADPDFLTVISGTSQGIISAPRTGAWNYQTFGLWENLGHADRNLNTISVGAPTAGSAIDTGGTATFTGKVVGSYVDALGGGNTVLADLTVNANFGTQSLALSTTNTQMSANGSSFAANNNLNMTGTLTYTPGTNSFSGQLQTANGLAGNSAGQFYGPAAQELGGVFSLTNTGGTTETYSGAYGAKR